MGITQFCRILSRKSLFAKSKLTNLKNTGVGGGWGGGGGGSGKYVYPKPPMFGDFLV